MDVHKDKQTNKRKKTDILRNRQTKRYKDLVEKLEILMDKWMYTKTNRRETNDRKNRHSNKQTDKKI